MTEEQEEILKKLLAELNNMQCTIFDGFPENPHEFAFVNGYDQAKMDLMFKIFGMIDETGILGGNKS